MRAIICDEDESSLFIATFILSNLNWEVYTRPDSFDLIGKVRECQPSVIVLGCKGNDEHGLQVIHILKKHSETKDLPIVFATGHSKIKELAAKAGADYFVAKPFDIRKLEAVMNEAYSRYKTGRSSGFSVDLAQDA